MKIAFPTSGKNIEAQLADVFGRAPGFLVYDTEKKTCDVIDNTKNLIAEHGVGMKSAELVTGSGANVIITKNCGPKAQDVFDSAGVKVVLTEESSISVALDNFIKSESK